mgnify:CR=1 FL=1|jgi:hypothetical protein|tara:strand:+ start:1639 stop:1896 length:258 start_codon:yes stop_codon:yes gene_type:complete
MVFEKGRNYCSFSPDRFWKYDWSEACYSHDRQYRNEVKKRLTRKKADINLRENIRKVLPKKLFFIAWFYYCVVRTFGWRTWGRYG